MTLLRSDLIPQRIRERADPSVLPRIAAELTIIHEIAQRAQALGFAFQVDYGDYDEQPIRERASDLIEHDIHACDEELLRIIVLDEEHAHHRTQRVVGSVFLVYGNSGWDVICDYSAMGPVAGIIDEMESFIYQIEAELAVEPSI